MTVVFDPPQLLPPFMRRERPVSENAAFNPYDLARELSARLGHAVTVKRTDDFTSLNGRPATQSELERVSAQVAEDPEIEWKYLPTGCCERAQLACDDLRERGLPYYKLFAFGHLEASNELFDATWSFHVAALTFVQGEAGRPEPRILDSALRPEPMRVEEWLGSLSERRVRLEFTAPEQLYPTELAVRHVYPFEEGVARAEKQAAKDARTVDAFEEHRPKHRAQR